MIGHICEWCGCIFTPAKGHKHDQRFCSKSCGGHSKIIGRYSVVTFNKCDQCGKWYRKKSKVHRLCTDECRSIYARAQSVKYGESKKGHKLYVCKMCSKEFNPRYNDKRRLFCSLSCCNRFERLKAGGNKNRHRAKHYNVPYEYVNVFKVFKRDSWICQICGNKTKKRYRGTFHPDAPELDHRIPISKGGGHTYENVQCACRRCNGNKSNNNSAGQLPLFGIKEA